MNTSHAMAYSENRKTDNTEIEKYHSTAEPITNGLETESNLSRAPENCCHRDDQHLSDLHIDRRWVWKSGCDWTKDNATFDIITYNILSDFFIHPEEGHNPFYPKKSLIRAKREKQLFKELEHHKEADIFCLQEVDPDYFPQVLEPYMANYGFRGYYMPEVMGKLDGLATFYKEDTFDLVSQKAVTFNSLLEKDIREYLASNGPVADAVVDYILSQCVAIFTKLRCKKTDRLITVANIHGLFGEYKKMDITVMQIATAIRVLTELNGPDNQPYILCGDFNQYIDMPGYQVAQNGTLTEHEKESLRVYPKVTVEKEEMNVVDIVPECFQHSASDITSSYREILGEEPKMTYNGHMDPSGALDFIWYGSDCLTCCGVLDVVSTDVIKQFNYCPNPVFPSDHLLMRSKFKFSS